MLKQIGTWKTRWKFFTVGMVLLIAVVTLTDAQDKKPPEKFINDNDDVVSRQQLEIEQLKQQLLEANYAIAKLEVSLAEKGVIKPNSPQLPEEMPREPQPVSIASDSLPQLLDSIANNPPQQRPDDRKIAEMYKMQNSNEAAVVFKFLKACFSDAVHLVLDGDKILVITSQDIHARLRQIFDAFNQSTLPEPPRANRSNPYQLPASAYPETVEANRLMVYRLLHTSASEVATQLRDFFPTIKINVETETNSLLIKAPASMFEAIREKVKELDVTNKTTKVYQLKNATAGG